MQTKMAEFSVLRQINGGEQRKKRALGLEFRMCWFGFLHGLPEVWYQGDLSDESILVSARTLYNRPITKRTGLCLNYLLKFHTWAPHLRYSPPPAPPPIYDLSFHVYVYFIYLHMYISTHVWLSSPFSFAPMCTCPGLVPWDWTGYVGV